MTTVMSAVLLLNGAINIWMFYEEQKRSMMRLQREKAEAGSARIAQYFREIETQIRWIVQSPWTLSTDDDRRVDGIRLMSLVPAVHELAILDPAGLEQVRLSRLGPDVSGSQIDWSPKKEYAVARSGSPYYGPIYFQRNSEPYVRLALSGPRRDTGVVIADINLKLIWNVVTAIQVGSGGSAFVVDGNGRLIAHPDISLVLHNIDLSRFRQVRAALSESAGDRRSRFISVDQDLQGQQVLSAHAKIEQVGWFLIVELPIREAFAPVYASLMANLAVLGTGVIVAILASLMLAQSMVRPIRKLQLGATQIGEGALSHRITITSGDELAALGAQFNQMAAQLESSYGTLEQKVGERTQQLALANQAKSRFLAAASHDLRQPLNALNLFVAQLRGTANEPNQQLLMARIDAALANMNELFDALLDISKLDAGVIEPNLRSFPISLVLDRLKATFEAAALAKGLRFRIVSSDLWVRSDSIFLERIASNLVSNAVRYTDVGGVLIGCRRHKGTVRLVVCDSGIGIALDQQVNVFAEFHQVAGPGNLGSRGLGLGLSIVDRLARLLAHPISVRSTEGVGSCFSVALPIVPAECAVTPVRTLPASAVDFGRGRLVLAVDDDPLALEAITGILEAWGFEVLGAACTGDALMAVTRRPERIDLIITDYHLGVGETGLALIEQIRAKLGMAIPALVVSGDSSKTVKSAVRADNCLALRKPLTPLALRAVLSKLLTDSASQRL
jgi:signal transduction histidine kinase/CheY-like chemotaxis protein